MNIISLGNNCDPALSLRELNLKKETLPFDWVRSNPKIIYDVLVNGTDKYLSFGKEMSDNFEIKHMFKCFSKFIKPCPISHINEYGQHFTHYTNITQEELRQKMNRYVLRLYDKLENSKNIIFVHTTENYIFHKLSRDNRDIYFDYLVKISEYIHNKYKQLDFKIINIEVGIERKDTNFINNYTMTYDMPFSDECENHTSEFFKPFRKEVTKILSKIFGSENYEIGTK